MCTHFFVSYHGALFVLQLGILDASIVCELNFLLSCRSLITSPVILSMFSSSMSGIQRSSGTSLGTTKNLHLALLSLCLNFTVHTPNTSISDWPCVFNMTELFFVVSNAANVDFGNNILNTLNGIKLSSLPVSILYIIHTFFWLVLDSILVNITDFTLSKFRYLILTKPKLLPFFSHSIVQGPSSCCISCTACFLVVTSDLVTAFEYSCRLPYSDSSSNIHCISCQMQGTASVGTQYHNICCFSQFSLSHCPFTAYSDLVFFISPYWVKFFHIPTIV